MSLIQGQTLRAEGWNSLNSETINVIKLCEKVLPERCRDRKNSVMCPSAQTQKATVPLMFRLRKFFCL